MEKFLNGKREESAKNVPLLFVASPSAKDSTWEKRSPGQKCDVITLYNDARSIHAQVKISCCLVFFFITGKSTLSLVSFAKYEWFEEWKDDKVTNRAPEYKELKQAFIDSVLEVVMGIFPKITRDKVTIRILSAVLYTYCILWSTQWEGWSS